ncbi:hypothetical protein ACA910_005946 [Epithemia clementina (nom. ined.)]
MRELQLDASIPEHICDLETVLATVKAISSSPATEEAPTFTLIPEHVDGAAACAKHQIQALLAQQSYSEDDEDALDDGFFLCDLSVVFQKLVAWRTLFPRIKPFYALKCNPDPMVAAILGSTRGTLSSSSTTAAGFDCASIPEIELALRSVSSRSAIYANPQRAEHDLDTALRTHQVRVLTFDGSEELYKIHRAHQQELVAMEAAIAAAASLESPPPVPKAPTPHLVLRILVPDEHSAVPLGEKFGAPPDRIESLVQLAMELELPIIGVSFHCGSGNHDPNSYVQAIRLAHSAMQVIDGLQQQEQEEESTKSKPSKCWLLDMGGGYPGADGAGASLGRFSGKRRSESISAKHNEHSQSNHDSHEDHDGHEHETARNIAMAVTPLIEELFPLPSTAVKQGEQEQRPDDNNPEPHRVFVISEPGRYFVQEAFCLCSRIYRIKVDHDPNDGNAVIRRHYYIAQGVQGVFKDRVLCNESFTPTPLKMQSEDDDDNKNSTKVFPSTVHGPSIPSTVHGPSGNDYDVICPDLLLPELVVGDWLVFDCMGAYTLSIAARSGRPTVRYVVGGGLGAGLV